MLKWMKNTFLARRRNKSTIHSRVIKNGKKHSQVNGIWKMTARVDLLSSQGHEHKFLKMSKKFLKHKMPLRSKTHKKKNKVSLDTVIKQIILNLQKRCRCDI